MDDWKQLKDYAQNGNEKAFATLMNRHIGLVYGVAIRKLGDTARAEGVTQAVFLTLAQQASTLKRQGTLSTWLYSTASHKAIDLLRTDTARKRREQAHGTLMQEDPSSNSHEVWLEIAPTWRRP